jgi:hypothetical protein
MTDYPRMIRQTLTELKSAYFCAIGVWFQISGSGLVTNPDRLVELAYPPQLAEAFASVDRSKIRLSGAHTIRFKESSSPAISVEFTLSCLDLVDRFPLGVVMDLTTDDMKETLDYQTVMNAFAALLILGALEQWTYSVGGSRTRNTKRLREACTEINLLSTRMNDWATTGGGDLPVVPARISENRENVFLVQLSRVWTWLDRINLTINNSGLTRHTRSSASASLSYSSYAYKRYPALVAEVDRFIAAVKDEHFSD